MKPPHDRPSQDPLDRALHALHQSSIPEGPPDKLVAETLHRLDGEADVYHLHRLQSRRKLMFRIFRYSSLAAAIAFLVALIGSVWFLDRTAPVAFADVLQNVKNAKSVVFNLRGKYGPGPELELLMYFQGRQMRMEMPNVMAQIADLQKKKGIQLDFIKKTAAPLPVHKDIPKAFFNPIDQFRKLKDQDAKRLEDTKLNGKTVHVYDVKKLNLLGMKGDIDTKLYVDPKSKMPVKIWVDWVNKPTNEKCYLIFDNFSWNQNLPAELFQLEPPKGYKRVKAPKTP